MEAPDGSRSVTAGLLGLGEHDLDDLKTEAVSAPAQRVAKKPKLTHGLFFDDERGLKKVVHQFPKLHFKGRGHEFEDLKVLLASYKRWLKELYPFEDNFEDFIWKARALLQTKEKGELGSESDPREQLHMLRYVYKSSGGGGTKAAVKAATDYLRKAVSAPPVLTEEVRKRIEENRQKALELKRKRQEEALAASKPKEPVPAATCLDEDEDVFGFGGGLDDEHRIPAQAASAASTSRTPVPAATCIDEEEAVFGFGGGLDDDNNSSSKVAATVPDSGNSRPNATCIDEDSAFSFPDEAVGGGHSFRKPAPTLLATAATVLDDDEDVFGFGGGLDEE